MPRLSKLVENNHSGRIAVSNATYFYLGLMLCVVVLNTAAQLLFKVGVREVRMDDIISTVVLNLPIVLGYLLFFAASVLYLFVIRHVPLTTAFPTTVLIHALVIISAHFLFGEVITLHKLIGILLMFTGVFFIWM